MIRTLTAALFVLLTAAAAGAADAPAASPGSSPDATAAAAASSSIKAMKAIPPGSQEPPAKPFTYTPKDSDIVMGKKDAPVTVVEYASLSCPHCAHFFENAMPTLRAKYFDSGKARLVYRHFPLNDPGLKGAELVQCAPADKREAYVKVLFSTQMKWAYDTNFRDALGNIAVLGGMDRLKFESCMSDKPIEKDILKVAREAQDDYGVNSTPTFFINGTEYKGDRDAVNMGKAIDAALAKSKAK